MKTKFSEIVDRVQYFGILISILVIPLVFYVGNQNIVLLKPLLAQLFMLALFALWIVDSVEREEFELPDNPLNIPIVAFFLWIILTIFVSSHSWFYSLEELARFTAVFLLFFLIQRTFTSFTRLKWGLWILFLVSILTTSYGYFQYLGFRFINWGKNVLVSTFGNQNFFTGFLVLVIPVIGGYIFATRKWIVRGVLAILLGANLYILMVTGTRTGFLGFLVGAIIFLILYLRFQFFGRNSKSNFWKLIGLLTISITLCIGIYLTVPEHLIRRLGTAFDLQRGTGRVRWIMWTGSTRAAQDNPIFGHGHGSFQLTFPFYRPRMYHRFRVSHNTRHSHNEYLEILMENGTIGLSLFLLIPIITGFYSYRFLKHNNSRYFNVLIIGLLSGIVGSFAQNFASVNLRWMSSTFSFWYVLAFIPVTFRIASNYNTRNRHSNERSIRKSFKYFPALSWKYFIHASLVILVLAAGFGSYSILMADFALKDLQFLIRATERQKQNKALIPIYRWNFMKSYYDDMENLSHKVYRRRQGTGYVRLNNGWRAAATVGKNAIQFNPFNLSALYKLGFVYLSMGDYKKAGQTYDQLTDIAPNYAQIHNNVAIIRKEAGKPYRALLHFEWATWLEDNFRNHQNLLRRYVRKKFNERAAYHAAAIFQVANEDLKNVLHQMSGTYSERNFPHGKLKSKVPKIEEKNLNALYYLQKFYSDRDKSGLSNFYLMTGFHRGMLSKNTFRTFMRQVDQKSQEIKLSILALVRHLRKKRYLFFKSERRRLPSFRKQYTQKLFQNYKKEGGGPLDRLILAELYAQLGQAETGWKLIKGDLKKLRDEPLYRDSIEFIKSQRDKSSGNQ